MEKERIEMKGRKRKHKEILSVMEIPPFFCEKEKKERKESMKNLFREIYILLIAEIFCLKCNQISVLAPLNV